MELRPNRSQHFNTMSVGLHGQGSSSTSGPRRRAPVGRRATRYDLVQAVDNGNFTPPENPRSPKILQREWKALVTSRLWDPPTDPPFRHPQFADKVTKSEASKIIEGITLTPLDLESLPHEERRSRYRGHKPMMLYERRAVRELAQEKARFFGKPPPANVTVGAFWYLKRHEPEGDEQPVEIDYAPHANAVVADPENIIWDGELIDTNVEVHDGCLMYLLERHQVQDLAGSTGLVSPVSLARRALEVHGGFHAHNELVKQRRREAIEAYSRGRKDIVGALSRELRSYIERGGPLRKVPRLGPARDLEDEENRTVKQYTPVMVLFQSYDDFGTGSSAEWLHGPNFGHTLREGQDY